MRQHLNEKAYVRIAGHRPHVIFSNAAIQLRLDAKQRGLVVLSYYYHLITHFPVKSIQNLA